MRAVGPSTGADASELDPKVCPPPCIWQSHPVINESLAMSHCVSALPSRGFRCAALWFSSTPTRASCLQHVSQDSSFTLLIALSSVRATVVPVTLQEGLLLRDLGVFSVSALYSPPSSSTPSLQACAPLSNSVSFRKAVHICSFMCSLAITCPCCVMCRQRNLLKL